MQKIDDKAIRGIGIPRLLLMEHAGLALARQVKILIPRPANHVLVCCGTGFNGGDGLSAARHLYSWDYPLKVVVTGKIENLREESATYATILRRLGIDLIECLSIDDVVLLRHSLAGCELVVDALLGIGARGVVREPIASLIKMLNCSNKPIVSADIPSGLNADTGLIQGVAVRAVSTVTFGLSKRGCYVREGPRYTGSLIVDNITIPKSILR